MGSNGPDRRGSTDNKRRVGFSLPTKKAPGQDGIPDIILKIVISKKPAIILHTCLAEGLFPSPWKVAKLVLLRKG